MQTHATTQTSSTNSNGSTGPRTAEGKAASRENAVRHSLAGIRFRLLPNESKEEFDELFLALVSEHQPQTQTEFILTLQLAQAHWSIQRAIDLCTEAIAEGDDKRLNTFMRYQNMHQRAFQAALKQLKALQKERAEQELELPLVKAQTAREKLRITQYRRVELEHSALPIVQQIFDRYQQPEDSLPSEKSEAA